MLKAKIIQIAEEFSDMQDIKQACFVLAKNIALIMDSGDILFTGYNFEEYYPILFNLQTKKYLSISDTKLMKKIHKSKIDMSSIVCYYYFNYMQEKLGKYS